MKPKMAQNPERSKGKGFRIRIRQELLNCSSYSHGLAARLSRIYTQLPRFEFKGRFLLPITVLAIGGYGFVELKASKSTQPILSIYEEVHVVEAVQARYKDFRPMLTLYGNTVAGRQVDLRALVAGKVKKTGRHLREGAEIKKGERLLLIEPFKYKGALIEAGAQYAEADAKAGEIDATITLEKDKLKFANEQLTLARSDLARAEPLIKRGAISKKVLDSRRVVVSQHRQTVKSIMNRIAILKTRTRQQKAVLDRLRWRVSKARWRLSETELTAPFDGIVGNIRAEMGRMLDVNDPVATLIDKDWIEVRFVLTDSQFGRIISSGGKITGRKISVRWHLGNQRLTYLATISRLGSKIAAQSGGVEIFARIETPSKPFQLRPGAFVEIELPDRAFRNVVELPQASLYGGNRVYVVENDQLVERRVTVVGRSGDSVLIRGGIKAGEHIMHTRLSPPRAGLKVREL